MSTARPTASPHPSRRLRRILWLSIGTALLLAGAISAVLLWPQGTPTSSAADSPAFETIDDLAGASDALVNGFVVGEEAGVDVDGIRSTVYTVEVVSSTTARSGELLVAVADPGAAEPTAETAPLRTGDQYVLALEEGDTGHWFLVGNAGQGAFPVSNGIVAYNTDLSLMLEDDIAARLGLTFEAG